MSELELTLTEAGAGQPVLVLHGGAGPGSVANLVEHFAADSHVLAPTHPGWEDTPRPEWFTGVDSLAVTYLDLLEDRDLSEVLVIGSSFGGWVAAEMAVRDRGQRIGRLVLMGAIGPEIPGHTVRVPGGGGGGGAPQGRGPSPAALATMRAYAGTSMNDPKLLRRLARVRTPALLVWGEQDQVVSPEFGRAYAAALPNSRFEVIAGAGHIPTREAPEAALAVIDGFLGR
ncbi:alpha/beta fold hydrolase [Kutzneria albida]|uniref:AB hydrolase-1 domain-containing protein n=1 Tax=Kutzneria albida DSM 43870 TaxID=1449976 RepID=W5WB96_9PSEU|nr:alpha/beta hydrolase [Kutzneria albida]AHH97801.1 hypothetical protein KALB_4439 [Kutzneria albida DSM 43870]